MPRKHKDLTFWQQTVARLDAKLLVLLKRFSTADRLVSRLTTQKKFKKLTPQEHSDLAKAKEVVKEVKSVTQHMKYATAQMEARSSRFSKILEGP